MRYGTLFLLLLTICSLAGCSNAQKPVGETIVSTPDQKILIVYLSRTNNTKVIAEFIREEVGGDLTPIELEKPYPADYKTTVGQVERENETGFLPPQKTKIDRIGEYDVVFVGFPTWGMRLPPPIKSFLRQYDLKGKTVVPFNTHAGYGSGSSLTTVKVLCSDCTVLEAFVTKGGIERDGVLLDITDVRATEVKMKVRDWLRKINMLQ